MERRREFNVFDIPVREIFFDADFNCRDIFALSTVSELSESISKHGLQFPIVVQPYDKPPHKYRILAGHRRFRACASILKWETIPAMVRPDLDEEQARILNVTENLERKDLNMLEEAKALAKLFPDGGSLRRIADALKRPTRWVHIRLRLLQLPEEVQKWAAAGYLSAVNLEAICGMKSKSEQIKAVNQIVTAKQEKGKTTFGVGAPRKFRFRKSKRQLCNMIALLMNAQLDGLTTRALAWAAGYLSDAEFRADIKACLDGKPLPEMKKREGLTDDEIRTLRAEAEAGARMKDLALKYKRNVGTIRNIVSRITYQDVT